jgi:hypothetical protein
MKFTKNWSDMMRFSDRRIDNTSKRILNKLKPMQGGFWKSKEKRVTIVKFR